MMDLITTFQAMNFLTGVSAVMIFGAFGTALMSVAIKMWQVGMDNSIVQSVVNTTLVLLETTEDVWRPIVNVTAVVLKPLAGMGLALLKPFGPYALAAADTIVRGMVLFGYITALVILEMVALMRKMVTYIQSTGMSLHMAVGNAVSTLKDLAFSFGTIAKALGYIASRLLYGVSYIVNSFEAVSSFLYTLVFEAHKMTWEDAYNVAIPFVVVGSILAYLVYRSSWIWAKTASNPKKEVECPTPRRSSRIARKRAMLTCGDLDSVLSSDKASSSTPNL